MDTHTWTHTHGHTWTHTHGHAHMDTHGHTHMDTHTWTHTHGHTHMDTHGHAHMDTHGHTHMDTHGHTHMDTRLLPHVYYLTFQTSFTKLPGKVPKAPVRSQVPTNQPSSHISTTCVTSPTIKSNSSSLHASYVKMTSKQPTTSP